jgi:voltage-gated potassium channel
MLRDACNNLRVEDVYIPDSLIGKDIESLNLKRFPGTLLLAVRSDGKWIYNPPGSHSFKPGDTLIVMTNPDERHKLQEALTA